MTMVFDRLEFELILNTAANLYNTAYDCDYQEGIVNMVALLLLPEVADDDQANIIIHRALKGS